MIFLESLVASFLISSIGFYFLRLFRLKAKMERIQFKDSLFHQIPICPHCKTIQPVEWTWANVFSECPECAYSFTRNQWYAQPQADDYPGGPLDKHRKQ